MNIDHFIVHINSKEINNIEGVIAEVDVYFTPDFCLRGFKFIKPGGWTIPRHHSYLSGKKETAEIINQSTKESLIKSLTNCLSSVKMVLSVDSYGKSYLVNSKGSTLIDSE